MTRAAAIASRAALAVLLAAAFLRALVAFEPFPYWSGDPTLINIPMTSLGPAGSLLIDAISLFAAAIILFTEPLLARRIQWIPFTLICIGSIGIIIHAWGHGPDLDNIRIGAGWAAALFGALAAAHAARDAHSARLIASAGIGLIAILALKGFMQVYVEHADNVTLYNQNKDAFLASQGWTPGSAAALSFERRLTQPEASGWFGLANVLASFAAASLTALLGWTILAWRETRTPDERLPSGWSGLLTIGALLAAAALYFAGAKGGYAAAALGVALLATAALIQCWGGRASSPTASSLRRARTRLLNVLPRLAPLLPLALIAAALGALVLRGLIGERLGELSLLFRWFYISTAARIFAMHPLAGIGPANFQDAYQLLKPATSPEEVTSPHSVLFDFSSTLGLFGLALAGVFLLWAARAGASLLIGGGRASSPTQSDGHSPRTDLWFLLFTSACPVLLAAWIEGPIATPDSTLMRLVALAAWVGIALAALALMRLTDSWRIPFAAAAIVLAVHGQIEVTPIWPNSCALYFLLLAAAGAPRAADPPQALRTLRFVPAIMLAGAGAVLIPAAIVPAKRWEDYLSTAAGQLSQYVGFRARLEVLRSNPRSEPGDSIDRLYSEIRNAIVPARRSNPPVLAHDLATVFDNNAGIADYYLREHALTIFPNHVPTLLAASRLCLQFPALEIDGHHPFAHDINWANRAETIARLATDASPTSAATWGWLGTLQSTRYDIDHDRSHLEEAVAAWTHATTLDPHGLSLPVRLMHAYLELGQPEQARLWAGRALQASADLHLDPLRQLSDPELAEVRRIAAPP